MAVSLPKDEDVAMLGRTHTLPEHLRPRFKASQITSALSSIAALERAGVHLHCGEPGAERMTAMIDGCLESAVRTLSSLGTRTNQDWSHVASARVALLAERPRDWDSHGALPVTSGARMYASLFIQKLHRHILPEPTIGATPGGGMSFLWRSPGLDVWAEVESSSISVWAERDNSDDIDELSFEPWRSDDAAARLAQLVPRQ